MDKKLVVNIIWTHFELLQIPNIHKKLCHSCYQNLEQLFNECTISRPPDKRNKMRPEKIVYIT